VGEDVSRTTRTPGSARRADTDSCPEPIRSIDDLATDAIPGS
jgi:hypothetical protein